MFNAARCPNITGKFRRSFSRVTSPPLDDRSATTPYGCWTFYFQVKTNNSQLHPHPAFLARNQPGDKEAIERALPKCDFYL